MGVTLSIMKLPHSMEANTIRFVRDGFFEDKYNSYNLLLQFDLDYIVDVWNKYCHEQPILSVEGAKQWLEDLKNREDIFEKNLDDLVNKKNKIWDYKNIYNSQGIDVQKVYEPAKLTIKERLRLVVYYQNQYTALKEILNGAIRLNSVIACDL